MAGTVLRRMLSVSGEVGLDVVTHRGRRANGTGPPLGADSATSSGADAAGAARRPASLYYDRLHWAVAARSDRCGMTVLFTGEADL